MSTQNNKQGANIASELLSKMQNYLTKGEFDDVVEKYRGFVEDARPIDNQPINDKLKIIKDLRDLQQLANNNRAFDQYLESEYPEVKDYAQELLTFPQNNINDKDKERRQRISNAIKQAKRAKDIETLDKIVEEMLGYISGSTDQQLKNGHTLFSDYRNAYHDILQGKYNTPIIEKNIEVGIFEPLLDHYHNLLVIFKQNKLATHDQSTGHQPSNLFDNNRPPSDLTPNPFSNQEDSNIPPSPTRPNNLTSDNTVKSNSIKDSEVYDNDNKWRSGGGNRKAQDAMPPTTPMETSTSQTSPFRNHQNLSTHVDTVDYSPRSVPASHGDTVTDHIRHQPNHHSPIGKSQQQANTQQQDLNKSTFSDFDNKSDSSIKIRNIKRRNSDEKKTVNFIVGLAIVTLVIVISGLIFANSNNSGAIVTTETSTVATTLVSQVDAVVATVTVSDQNLPDTPIANVELTSTVTPTQTETPIATLTHTETPTTTLIHTQTTIPLSTRTSTPTLTPSQFSVEVQLSGNNSEKIPILDPTADTSVELPPLSDDQSYVTIRLIKQDDEIIWYLIQEQNPPNHVVGWISEAWIFTELSSEQNATLSTAPHVNVAPEIVTAGITQQATATPVPDGSVIVKLNVTTARYVSADSESTRGNVEIYKDSEIEIFELYVGEDGTNWFRTKLPPDNNYFSRGGIELPEGAWLPESTNGQPTFVNQDGSAFDVATVAHLRG